MEKENTVEKLARLQEAVAALQAQVDTLTNLPTLLHESLSYTNNVITRIGTKMVPRPILPQLEVHLTEHCNLNCRGCSVCAPLAEKTFLSVESFAKDMERLAKLSQGRIATIALIGGEPLLHPDVIAFMEIARRHFPHSVVEIITNGLLLMQKDETFWRAANKNNVLITPTKYPISLPFAEIEQRATEYGVQFKYFSGTDSTEKTLVRHIFDLTGTQDPVLTFCNCYYANNCVTLKEGKIYPCAVAPFSKHFSTYFEKNLELTERDSINIHTANTMDDILKFVATPIPFCRYCNIFAYEHGLPWGTSRKNIKEWTL